MTNPIRFEKKSIDNEALFLQQYEWLLKRARQITRGKPGDAEDLVQDLYVRFVHTSISQSLTTDDQVRAYLYTALKNLHISKKLRSGRDAISGLRAVDFDSVESAILSIERTQLLYVRSDLAQICEYVCGRRASSRAASALTLRFFLGYLPPEIMALFKLTRSNVHSLIESSRVEAKAFVARRGNLRFMGATVKRNDAAHRCLPERTEALFFELQRRIFLAPDGSCFAPGELELAYCSDAGVSFDTLQIAHLASCRLCLHAACVILRLPTFTSRSMDDHDRAGHEVTPPPPSNHVDLHQLHRKLRETDEHKPKKLQIVVDGEIKGIQSITSVESRVQIALPPLHEPRFLEIFSEQGIGLLYLDLLPDRIEDSIPKTGERPLSGGRHLEVELTLEEGTPVVELYYYDPLMEAVPEVPGEEFLSETTKVARTSEETAAFRSRAKRWLYSLRILLSRRMILVVLLAVACIGAAALFRHKPHPEQRQTSQLEPASSLFERSRRNQRESIPPNDGVRATYRLEIFDAQRAVRSTSVVKVVKTVSSKQSRLWLRTTRGRLLAEQRTSTDGKDIFSSARRSPSSPEVAPIQPMWEHVPDVDDFLTLAQSSPITISANTPEFEVAFSRERPTTGSAIVAGHLQLSSATLRPIAETLEVANGALTSSYHFSEASYQVIDAKELATELSADEIEAGDSPNRASSLPSLILKTLAALHSTPDAGRTVDLTLVNGQQIFLSGVLSTPASKELLSRRLKSLHASNLHLENLHAIGEAVPRQTTKVQSSPIASIFIAENPNKLPLADMLQSSGTGPLSDEELKARAHHILDDSSALSRQTWFTTGMTNRWIRTEDIRRFSPEEQRRWVELVEGHLRESQLALDGIASDLHVESANSTAQPLPDIESFTVLLEDLRSSGVRLDHLLVAGFSVSFQDFHQPLDASEITALISSMRQQESILALTIERLH